jgi:hypothetical protein
MVWPVFPLFETPLLFAALIRADEMPYESSCPAHRSLDDEQASYDRLAVADSRFRTVVHFCVDNGAGARFHDSWDSEFFRDAAAFLRGIREFAGYPFAFDSFAGVRERLLSLLESPPAIQRLALSAIGLFGCASEAGVRWFLAQRRLLAFYEDPPGDRELLLVLLRILGDGHFGICNAMQWIPPAVVEVVLVFLERVLLSDSPDLQIGAMLALAHPLRAGERGAGMLQAVVALMGSDCGFAVRAECLRLLSVVFAGSREKWVWDGIFLRELIEWFEPMLTSFPNEVIDAVREVFRAGCENADLAEWLAMTRDNEELVGALREYVEQSGGGSHAPMDPVTNAIALLHQFSAWKAA